MFTNCQWRGGWGGEGGGGDRTLSAKITEEVKSHSIVATLKMILFWLSFRFNYINLHIKLLLLH